MTSRPPIPIPVINPARCTGCGRCVAVCPLHLLSLEPRGWVKTSALHDEASCNGCRQCQKICPFRAIRMEAPDG